MVPPLPLPSRPPHCAPNRLTAAPCCGVPEPCRLLLNGKYYAARQIIKQIYIHPEVIDEEIKVQWLNLTAPMHTDTHTQPSPPTTALQTSTAVPLATAARNGSAVGNI